MINWKCRFRNWHWVASFISQLMIIIEIIFMGLNSLGVTQFQFTEGIQHYILTLANAIFILLSLLGLVQDPTTKGYTDSERALKYDKPK